MCQLAVLQVLICLFQTAHICSGLIQLQHLLIAELQRPGNTTQQGCLQPAAFFCPELFAFDLRSPLAVEHITA